MKLELEFLHGNDEWNESPKWHIYYWKENVINKIFPKHIVPIKHSVAILLEKDKDIAKEIIRRYNKEE
ncbi:hypothetical protein LCGC14_1961580 [marine sediment metagenome]|uniref:Uncharacterized protein n=1 Tax=marine sediment metagenome TaxID=412755 RepID=A0A0F9FEQ0_9ZZZZ